MRVFAVASLATLVGLAAPALAADAGGTRQAWHLRARTAEADLDPVAQGWMLRLAEKIESGAPGVVVAERSQGLRAVATRGGRPDRTFALDARTGEVTITDDRHGPDARKPIVRTSRRDPPGTLAPMGPIEARRATSGLPQALRRELIARRDQQPTIRLRRVTTEHAGWVVEFARVGDQTTWHELRPPQGDHLRGLVRPVGRRAGR